MPYDPDGQGDRDMELVKRHVEQLAIHFDTVQIFVTRPALEGTMNCVDGTGNYFARYGHVRSWLLKQDEYFRDQQRQSESD